MPTSGYHKIPAVMSVLQHVKDVRTVLDVGIGFGKYGFLMREHLDVRRRCYSPTEWLTQIDGVEIWDRYITPVQRYVYDQIYIGDIRELEPQLPAYDLILLCDVIEHMPYLEGVMLLQALFERHTKQAIVVSYPPIIGHDWKRWENPNEKHHVVWTPKMLRAKFPGRVIQQTPQVCFLVKES